MTRPKGNKHATGKKAGHGPELVQRIRAVVLGALDAVEKDGKLISEILAEKFKDDPLRFMDMASKYCPKEVAMEVSTTVLHTSEMSEVELERIATGSSAGATEKASGPKEPGAVH